MKKLVILIMAAVVCFSFAACDKASDSPGGKNITPDESEKTAQSLTVMGEPMNKENKEEMKVIGNDEFGYVSVPKDWIQFQDLDGGTDLQYSNLLGSSIITLNIFGDEGLTEEQKNQLDANMAAQSVWYNLEQNDVSDIEGASVKLGQYDAFQVYGYFVSEDHGMPSIIVCWTLEDEKGIIHYISAEGGLDDISNVVSYVEKSYSLVQPDSAS